MKLSQKFFNEAQNLMGPKIPKNKKRATIAPLKKLIVFTAEREGLLTGAKLDMSKKQNNESDKTSREIDGN